MKKLRVGIVGYGNIGIGAELALKQNPDMELAGVFTRRDPASLELKTPGAKAFSLEDALKMRDLIDVMILCGGSATDLPIQTPEFAKIFNVVDSFDTHANIPAHFAAVDTSAKEGKKTAVISAGWDPGLFSLMRLYNTAVLPQGNSYTFWGPGVSQGHSDAIRRVKGVVDARQYTVPVESAVDAVRNGENPKLTTRQKHTRVCYVVAEEGADKQRIEQEIKTMPNYFSDYDTTVTFLSLSELKANHGGLPHGGFVITSGSTGGGCGHIIEYKLQLDSNSEFTSSILVAYARAAARLSSEGFFGAKTVFDIAPAYLLPKSHNEIIATLL